MHGMTEDAITSLTVASPIALTVKAFGISSESKLSLLFATHPPIQASIAALQTPA